MINEREKDTPELGSALVDADTLHAAYTIIMSGMALDIVDRRRLRTRGLSDEDIERLGYRTWGGNIDYRKRLLAKVYAVVGDRMYGVPGVHKTQYGPDLAFSPGVGGGLPAVPVRDAQGRIRGVRVRTEKVELNKKGFAIKAQDGKPKIKKSYLWVSGRNEKEHPEDARRSACCHVPLHDATMDLSVVGITEGEIKSDIATLITRTLYVSVPGVSCWRHGLEEAKSLGASKVLLAYDADAETKAGVADAVVRSFDGALEMGLIAAIQTWPTSAEKGIDDALVKGGAKVIRTLDGDDAAIFIDKLAKKHKVRRKEGPSLDAVFDSATEEAASATDDIPKDEAAAKEPGATGKEGALPRVRRGRDVHRVLEDLDKALADPATGDPRLYQRDGELVLARGVMAEDAERLRIKFAPEAIILCPLRSSSLLPRITEHVDFGYKDKGTWRGALPPGVVVSSFLTKPFWGHIRRIRGVSVTPIIHLDGSICADGYDPVTQYLVASNVTLPEIPDKATHEHGKAGLTCLLEPFSEFPFETEAERYTPVALALTILLRSVIRGNVPAFIQTAPQKNCGKSLATKGACVVATGQIPASNTWARLEEEQEKMIGAAADAGSDVLFFDNAQQGAIIGGAPLDKVLTCDGHNSFRVLGFTKLKALPWGTVVAFTGNRVKLGGDTDRRAVVATLIRPDVPKEKFKHPELLQYIQTERPRLLAAAFTLIRAWVQAGSPTAGLRRLDSFEHWGNIVAAMIKWAGGGDVRSLVHDGVTDDDGEELALLAGMHAWLAAEGKKQTTVKDLVEGLWEGSVKPMDDDGFGELRSAIEAIAGFKGKGDEKKLDVRRLGNRLKAMKDVLQGGHRLKHVGKAHGGYATWSVTRNAPPKATTDNARGEHKSPSPTPGGTYDGIRSEAASDQKSSTCDTPKPQSGESGESGESNRSPVGAKAISERNGDNTHEKENGAAGVEIDSPDSPDSPNAPPPTPAPPLANDLSDAEREALLYAV